MNTQEQQSPNQLEQNKREQPMSHLARTAAIGFFGGLLWSFIGFMAYYFNFIAFSPSFALDIFMIGDWKEGVLGHIIGILFISLLSIGVAYLYYFTMRKFEHIFVGILFGLALWLIVFYLLQPIFSNVKPIADWDLNTIITSLCLYILYGIFVGYSISFDAKELNQAQQQVKESYSNE